MNDLTTNQPRLLAYLEGVQTSLATMTQEELLQHSDFLRTVTALCTSAQKNVEAALLKELQATGETGVDFNGANYGLAKKPASYTLLVEEKDVPDEYWVTKRVLDKKRLSLEDERGRLPDWVAKEPTEYTVRVTKVKL